MARAELTLVIVAGEPRIGLWCDDCLTSGRIEADVFSLHVRGLTKLGTYSGCSTCRSDVHTERDRD